MRTVNHSQAGSPIQGYATVPATSDAKEYLRLLLRHKFGLLFTFLLGLLFAWLYLISTDRVYETAALVEVNEVANFLEDQGAPQIDWNAPTIKEETNLLRSRRVLTPVIDQFGLRINVQAKQVPVLSALTQRIAPLADWVSGLDMARSYAWVSPVIDVPEFEVPREWEDQRFTLVSLGDGEYSLNKELQTLFDSALVGERIQVDVPGLDPLIISVMGLQARPGVEFELERSSLQATVSALRRSLATETSDSKSRMITVKLQGKDPERTARTTNAIVSEYQNVKLGSQNLKSDTEFEFYEASLPQVERELRAAESALALFRDEASSFNQDVQVQAKLGQLDKLETELLELELEKDEISERYTDAHPSTRLLDKEITVLQRKISQVKGSIQGAPDTERELGVLEEQVETKRALFTEMSEKLQKLRIARGGNVGSVQIIDDALTPRKPVSPNALLAIVGGTLSTLFLYLLYLTLRSALSTVINDQESLERASGLPVFMNIPKSAAQRRLGTPVTADPRRLLPGSSATASDQAAMSNVLALTKPDDYSIENLRGLRSMLEDVMAGASNNVLMITSPLPSMGKSFVSANLAVLLAQAGKRVLLIDADFQRGLLHKTLGLDMGPGLPEVVRGKSELKETVKATAVPNLYCIPKGFMGGAPGGEMPTDKEFGAFMRVVAPRFDIAIIDTPPVLSVSTAATLGKHAGSTMMVVKENEVKEPQLTESLKRLMYSGVRVKGCILNASSSPTPNHYTYYREQLD